MAALGVELVSQDSSDISELVTFTSFEALAEAMAKTSAAKTLAFSVLHDQQCLRVTRPGITA